MTHLRYALFSVLLIGFTSCNKDTDNYENVSSRIELEDRITRLYGSKIPLFQPLETDYNAIPSDPNNPITAEKVELGKMLYHETMIAKNAVMDDGMNTYSCASCHHVDAGFQSGLKQGIGEGGLGFGSYGEGRVKNSMYGESDLDVQPIRTPTTLNVAFQKVML